MPALDLDNVLARLAQTPPIWWVIWIGLLLMTIALLALMRTRWGQSQPLKKCLALSILAHLLMAGYATTVQIVHNTIGPGPATSGIKVSSVRHEGGAPSARQGGTAVRSVDAFAETSPEGIAAPSMDRAASAVDAEIAPLASTAAQPLLAAESPRDSQSTAIAEPASELVPPEEAGREVSPESATPLEDAPTAQRAERATTSVDAAEALERPSTADESIAPEVADATLNALLGPLAPISPTTVPDPAAAVPAGAPPVDAIAGRTSTPLEAAAAAAAEKFLAEAGGPTPAATERFSPTQLPDAPGISGPNGIPLGPASAAGVVTAPAHLLPVRQEQALEDIPEIYRGRMEQEAGSHDAGSGATGETEEAVKSALAWLAANQSRDGRWDAERFGAGTERREIGPKGMPQDRGRAGVKADTGVTGLALLAFLGAGHTHLSGEHRETVRRGLDFLLTS
ncbi:MAG: hypothetical protein JNG90_04310, partial [Planctomycetaceae bacterium]|nr:hypothetical protein [Planctomycetaceae bacterium]